VGHKKNDPGYALKKHNQVKINQKKVLGKIIQEISQRRILKEKHLGNAIIT